MPQEAMLASLGCDNQLRWPSSNPAKRSSISDQAVALTFCSRAARGPDPEGLWLGYD